MGLLDSIGKVDVRLGLCSECSYEINDEINFDELLKNSPFRLNLLFYESFSKDELVSLCEQHSSELINSLSYIPEISEFSKVCIVWDRSYDCMNNGNYIRNKKYNLMIGMNFYKMTPYSAIWTFVSIVEMMKRARMCFNDTRIEIRGYNDGRIIDRLEYGDYVETYNIGMNYENYKRTHTEMGDARFRFSNQMHEFNRDLFGYIIGRPIEKEEWDECVNKSYKRYKKIYQKRNSNDYGLAR